MHIIIDGYNVIGIFHKDMENARNRFVRILTEYRRISHHDITVVFDGYKSGTGQENVSIMGGVRIIYSRLGERADDVIKKIISDKKREWIVVSDDREIVNHAWASNSVPIPAERFYEIISTKVIQTKQSLQIEQTDDFFNKEDDLEYMPSQKGNPRQLSRKEKAIRRALSKL